MLLAVVAVLTIGGLAMATNLGLVELSDRSLQFVDAASSPVGELGAPLVSAVPSEDGSRQAFVIDGVGMVQITRGLEDGQPSLSISDVQAQSGWKADLIPISPSAVRVEFRSARRAMDFEAFLADDLEIAARFRISPRGAPLVVTAPDVAGVDDADGTSDGAAGSGSGDSDPDDETGASTATTTPPADPSSAPATGGGRSAEATSEDRATTVTTRIEQGTWIYYQDGEYVLDNTLRGSDRSRLPGELSTDRGRSQDKADPSRGSGRSNGQGNGPLDDD